MIRLTLVTQNLRGRSEHFDTDDLSEALTEYSRRHLAGGSHNAGPKKWIVAFVVEQNGERYEPYETAMEFRSITSLEEIRESHRRSDKLEQQQGDPDGGNTGLNG